ncbi:hypothetical protein FRC06_006527, partial [Ceratobasidium sp. 370]
MSQSTETICLNCHVLGDTSNELMPISISLDLRIADLRSAILAKYEAQGFGQLQRSVLSKVDFSVHDIPNVPAQLQEPNLINTYRVKQYWETPGQIAEDRVHVLVRAMVIRPLTPERNDTLNDLPDILRELQIGQQITAKKFREGKPAWAAAVHSQFAVEQQHAETAILNGRPQERVGLPVQLFHPVFDTFTKTLESANLLPPSKYVHTEELLHASQDIYREDGREGTLMSHLIIALASTIDNEPVPKCNAAGVVKFVDTATASNAYCAIIE